MASNADILWKMVVHGLFEDLVAFALPELHAAVRWDMEVKFLEQEMPKIKMPRKKGTRYVDILASMYLEKEEESLLLLHLEIQDDPIDIPVKLNERMYQYYVRICDKLEKEITALALLIGEANDRGVYHKENFGTEITYKYNVLHIKGLNAQALEKSGNPFALAALAGQKMIQAKGNDEKKFGFARKLFKLLKMHGHDAQKTTALFIFLEGLFAPKDKMILQEYNKEVEKMICNQELPMVMTPTVRRWCKEAELEGKREAARNFLAMGLSVDKVAKGTGLSEEEVLALKTDD